MTCNTPNCTEPGHIVTHIIYGRSIDALVEDHDIFAADWDNPASEFAGWTSTNMRLCKVAARIDEYLDSE